MEQIIINCETLEQTVEIIPAELLAADKAAAEAAAAEAAAKEAARQALLDKLGITADEAKLLLS